MGAYTTKLITREDALAEIFSRLRVADTEVIANILFDLKGKELLENYVIVTQEFIAKSFSGK